MLLCLVCGVLAFACAPALALSQRGHVFGFSFGTKGEGAGKLSSPTGIAVNEATHDVYVVDAANNRVERFNAKGEFLTAWGWGVSDGKEEYEVCNTGCKAGIAGSGEGQFDAPEAIAVDSATNTGEDPSAGDVYVVANRVATKNVVEKFSASGTPLGALNTENTGELLGVAVDSGGVVWVDDSESRLIESFTDAAVNEVRAPVAVGVGCALPGFAVDAMGEAFYVNHEREDKLEAACPEVAPSEKAPALIAKLDSGGEPLSEALDGQNSSAVAVDHSSGEQASGDVFVDNVSSIAAFTSAGSLIQRFGSEAELSKGRGVAVDPHDPQAEGGQAVYVVSESKDKVLVFVPAAAGPPMVDGVSSQNLDPTSTELKAQVDPDGADTHYLFQYGTVDCAASPASCTSVPAAPADLGSAFGDQSVSVQLHGLQPGTTYFYRAIAENEHGSAEGAQTVSTFTTLPDPVGLLPDARAWELVSPPEKGGAGVEAIGGSAENSGPTGGVMEASEDGNAVTYVTDGPVLAEPEGSRSPEGTQVLANRSAEAWSSQEIVTPHAKGEGFPAGKPQEYQFFSSDLSYALLEPWGLTNLQEPPLLPGAKEEERGIYRRSNATCLATPASCYQPVVTAENDTNGEKFGGQVGIVQGGGALSATPDLSHVVFSAEVPLTAGKPSAPGLYEFSAQKLPAEQLQLVSVLPSGKPVAEAEGVALGDSVPQGVIARNAISGDGSRVFWTNPEGDRLYMRDTTKGQTLQINAPAAGVKKLSNEQAERAEEVRFQTASTDGSRVFFTDTVALTAQSTLEPQEGGPADLYECEVTETAGKLECDLRDLTVDPHSEFGEQAEVVGKVLGASDDGSSVYFVANGALAPGAAAGDCLARPGRVGSATASCSLYREHYDSGTKEWEKPRFLASLSEEDKPDWGSDPQESLGRLTARVSPDGRYLAFMSDRPLTGYDNVDANPAAHGARDEEVFLYDSERTRLVCASCKAGGPPHGVLDTERAGEGHGLLVDRPGNWSESQAEVEGKEEHRPLAHWLAGSIPGWTPLEFHTALYQSRYLSDQGRLFFDSADALLKQDVNSRQEAIEGKAVEVGVEDVYEYEPEGDGGCGGGAGCVSLISSGTSAHESAFLDASSSGGDVFFVTAAQLVAGDHDNSFDLYDARVCTEASPCLSSTVANPSPCEAEPSAVTCKGPEPPQPTYGASASMTFSGPGNITANGALAAKVANKPKPLTRAQKLARALRACRSKWKKSKRKRIACERKARRKYPAKKTVKRPAAKKASAARIAPRVRGRR